MNIVLTGGTSQIGKLLTAELHKHGHQVIQIGRGQSNAWQLGLPIPKTINGEVLIHLAHDRTRSVAETITDVRILLEGFSGFSILLSSTSAHALARSNYGKSKYLSEQLFIENRGSVIKAGLIYGSIGNRFLDTLSKILRSFRCVILPYRGNSRFFVSDADVLVAEVICTAQTKRTGKIRAFSLMPSSFRNLLIKTNSDLKFKIFTIPSIILSNLLIYSIHFLLPRNESIDSLVSLVSEINLQEIITFESPVNDFNLPIIL
jgi:hypothetical protein